MGHRPWYASTSGASWPPRSAAHVQAAFEPLFHEFGVDLYLAGHQHYYERTARAHAGVPTPNGTMHVINGAAGCNEGLDAGKGVGGLIVAASYRDAGTGYGELSVGASAAAHGQAAGEAGGRGA